MIRVALIGLGRMGRRWWPHLLASRRFALVGVVDPVAPDATHREVGALSFDAAIVAAPTPSHYELSAGLLRRGCHVLVEKPVAATYAEAGALCALSAGLRARLVVGHVERFNPAARAFLEAVRSGIVGAPEHVGAIRTGPRPDPVAPGNSAALDLAVHDLDLLRLAVGDLEVEASTGNRDRVAALLASRDGVQATVTAAWGWTLKQRRLWCMGERGTVRADLLARTCRLDGRPLHVPQGDALAAQLDALADLIETGDEGALCSAEDGAEAVRLVEAATAIGAARRAA